MFSRRFFFKARAAKTSADDVLFGALWKSAKMASTSFTVEHCIIRRAARQPLPGLHLTASRSSKIKTLSSDSSGGESGDGFRDRHSLISRPNIRGMATAPSATAIRIITHRGTPPNTVSTINVATTRKSHQTERPMSFRIPPSCVFPVRRQRFFVIPQV